MTTSLRVPSLHTWICRKRSTLIYRSTVSLELSQRNWVTPFSCVICTLIIISWKERFQCHISRPEIVVWSTSIWMIIFWQVESRWMAIGQRKEHRSQHSRCKTTTWRKWLTTLFACWPCRLGDSWWNLSRTVTFADATSVYNTAPDRVKDDCAYVSKCFCIRIYLYHVIGLNWRTSVDYDSLDY